MTILMIKGVVIYVKNSGFPNLRALRIDLEMTQEEFATSLGISKTTYNNYEIGTREPRSDFWERVAQKYNVTVDYLLGLSSVRGTQKSPAPEESEAEEDDPRVDKLGTPKSAYDLFYSFLIERGYLKEGDNFTPSQARFFSGLLEIVNAAYPAPAIQVDAENVG